MNSFVDKRRRDKEYYQRHKERLKRVKAERTKQRLGTDEEYKFKQSVDANHRQYKKEILDKFNNKCPKCGSIEDLQIHHLKYVKGREGLNYVTVLCRKCHYNIHYPLPSEDIRMCHYCSKRYSDGLKNFCSEECHQNELTLKRDSYHRKKIVQKVSENEVGGLMKKDDYNSSKSSENTAELKCPECGGRMKERKKEMVFQVR